MRIGSKRMGEGPPAGPFINLMDILAEKVDYLIPPWNFLVFGSGGNSTHYQGPEVIL